MHLACPPRQLSLIVAERLCRLHFGDLVPLSKMEEALLVGADQPAKA